MVRFTLSLLALLAVSNSVVNSAFLNKRMDKIVPALIGTGAGMALAGGTAWYSHRQSKIAHQENIDLERQKHKFNMAAETHKAILQNETNRAKNNLNGTPVAGPSK